MRRGAVQWRVVGCWRPGCTRAEYECDGSAREGGGGEYERDCCAEYGFGGTGPGCNSAIKYDKTEYECD